MCVCSITSVLVDVDDPSQSSTFKGKMTVGRRRMVETLGQKMGKQSTDDAEFQERYKAVLELQTRVLKVKDAMKSLLDSTRAMSQRAVDLSNACGEADARDQDFITTQLKLDASMRSRLDESVGKALDSLDRKLMPFKDLEERVRTRNRLKLDYDHYVRKVRRFCNLRPTKILDHCQYAGRARLSCKFFWQSCHTMNDTLTAVI